MKAYRFFILEMFGNIQFPNISRLIQLKEFFMKNKKTHWLPAVALALTLALVMPACGNGSTGGPGPGPGPGPVINDPASYEGIDADGNYYTLVITRAAKASIRAAITPQNGDNYVLTIYFANGEIKISKGTVTGTTGGLQLKPAASDTTFTVKIENGSMTAIQGTIAVESGAPIQVEASITYAWKLTANIWNEADGQHSNWSSGKDLSEFTSRKPKEHEETFIFTISGTPDKAMKNFGITIESYTGNWQDYQWLGGSEQIEVEAGKAFSHDFCVTIWAGNDDNPIKSGSTRKYNVGINNSEDVPEGKKSGDIMAVIKNFEIKYDTRGDLGDIGSGTTITAPVTYDSNIPNLAEAKSRTDFSYVYTYEWQNGQSVYVKKHINDYIPNSSVTVSGGNVTIKLGKCPDWLSRWGLEMLDGVTVSNPYAKVFEPFFQFDFYTQDEEGYSVWLRYYIDESGLNSFHDAYLVYATQDVTITGTITNTYHDGTKWTQTYNLSLKAGWNWIEHSGNVSGATFTASQSMPSGFSWIINGGGGGGSVSGGGSSPYPGNGG
jgi:hypothetical protein